MKFAIVIILGLFSSVNIVMAQIFTNAPKVDQKIALKIAIGYKDITDLMWDNYRVILSSKAVEENSNKILELVKKINLIRKKNNLPLLVENKEKIITVLKEDLEIEFLFRMGLCETKHPFKFGALSEFYDLTNYVYQSVVIGAQDWQKDGIRKHSSPGNGNNGSMQSKFDEL